MKNMTIADAAKRLNVDEKEVKNMCKNGYLEVTDVPGELPGITEQSVCEFLGEDYEDPEPAPVQKKRGRQPKVLCHGAAAEMLGKNIDEVIQLAFDDVLEEWELPDSEDMGVTKRSVQAYMKDNIPSEEPYEHNGNFDVSEERELNKDVTDTHVGETGEAMAPVDEIEEAHQEHFSDAVEAATDVCMEDHARRKFLEASAGKLIDKSEETVTMKKGDYHSALTIAAMKAEIEVYRSLKSFERR